MNFNEFIVLGFYNIYSFIVFEIEDILTCSMKIISLIIFVMFFRY